MFTSSTKAAITEISKGLPMPTHVGNWHMLGPAGFELAWDEVCLHSAELNPIELVSLTASH